MQQEEQGCGRGLGILRTRAMNTAALSPLLCMSWYVCFLLLQTSFFHMVRNVPDWHLPATECSCSACPLVWPEYVEKSKVWLPVCPPHWPGGRVLWVAAPGACDWKQWGILGRWNNRCLLLSPYGFWNESGSHHERIWSDIKYYIVSDTVDSFVLIVLISALGWILFSNRLNSYHLF